MSSSAGDSLAGRRTTKRAPPPSASLSSTVPPWPSATARTIARPRPLPGRGSPSPSPWAKRSNTRSRSSGGTPGPRSETSSTAWSPSLRTATVTGVPAGVWISAFSIRLRATRCRSSGTAASVTARGRVHRHLALLAERLRLGRRLAGHRGQVHRPPRRLAAGVGAGQQQQVGHQAAHPARGAQRGGGDLLRLALEVGLEQLEVGEDAGERRAQLVRGVGHELALAAQGALHLGRGRRPAP